MLEARKSVVVAWCFRRVQKRLLRATFGKLYVQCEGDVSGALLVGNHSSWWDGLVLFELERASVVPHLYTMMAEEGLRRVPIFRWIGAFSIRPDDARDVMRSLAYAGQLLHEGKTVVLFPQGEERHLELRPLGFLPGAAMLAKRQKRVRVAPFAFYYTVRNERKLEAWVRIGKPVEMEVRDVGKATEMLEQAVTSLLDALKVDVVAHAMEKYEQLL